MRAWFVVRYTFWCRLAIYAGTLAAAGCASLLDERMGRLQLTHAGRKCSFETSLLLGPFTARGRNEGYLKSSDEIYSLAPYVAVMPRYRAAQRIAAGMTYDEYVNRVLRCPANLNMQPDVLPTIQMCQQLGCVSAVHVTNVLRILAHSNFLSTDVIVAAYDGGALSREEARTQLWHWISATYQGYTLNYYIHAGNEHMVRKLHERALITHDEAVYLLSRWFLAAPRIECSMVNDMEYVGLITSDEAAALLMDEGTQVEGLRAALLARDTAHDRAAAVRARIAAACVRPASLPKGLR